MTKDELKLFIKQVFNSRGESLKKAKKFFKEPNDKKLKKRLLKILSEL